MAPGSSGLWPVTICNRPQGARSCPQRKTAPRRASVTWREPWAREPWAHPPHRPARVDYALTPMGPTLLETVHGLIDWADTHLPDIGAARAAYDRRVAPRSASRI